MTQIAQITQKMAKLFSASSESSEKSAFAFVRAIEADRGGKAKPTRSTIQNHSSPRMMSLRRIATTIALASVFSIAAACRTGTPAPQTGASGQQALSNLYDPSRALGPLFHDVQLSGIFPDSKTFVDARPRLAPSEIAARYAAERGPAQFNLRSFVEQHFELPRPAGEGVRSDTSQSMEEHIRALWPALTRAADTANPRSSLIPLPKPYVVPGGRFREVYYWDSYFTMLGLVASGRTDLVRSMLDNLAHLVQIVGHIPNGTRTYFLI